jgi:hypothetical protein
MVEFEKMKSQEEGQEMVSRSENDAAMFHHPFTMTVAGSTGSGKSEWVKLLLSHLDTSIQPKITSVVYCYGELNENLLLMQKEAATMNGQQRPQLHVHHGCPKEEQVQNWAREANGRLLLVLDDLMVGMRQPFLDTLFTRGSHNWGASVVLVTQHLFTRELRVARNNSHYIVLMRNPAGALQVRNLATQLFPSQSAYFMEAYADATKGHFGYLLIDMHPTTEDEQRLKTHIYATELQPHPIVYVPTANT